MEGDYNHKTQWTHNEITYLFQPCYRLPPVENDVPSLSCQVKRNILLYKNVTTTLQTTVTKS